ncbi:MAG: pilus assembly protein PilM [Roseburia sp.]|nr:pilus assembly protein PilM [Roseburia sp.]
MKILSIEIGVDVTHVLEMDYRVKNPKVYRSFSFQTPVGVIGEAGVRKSEEFRTALHKLLDANKIKTRKTLFVVNSGKIASREVLIPMIKENRIKDFLNTNSADFFPVDLSRYQLVYRNEGVVQQDTVKKRKLYVFAVPGDLVQSYEELADFCSLELTALDYVGNSIFQMMHKAVGNNICCSVKLDNNATMITIINQGMVVLQRTVFYGFEEVEKVVVDSSLFPKEQYPAAMDILQQTDCLDANQAAPEDAVNAMRAEAVEALRPMIGNIRRVLDYYQSRNNGAEVKECFLIGNGAYIKGLDRLMSMELNLPVHLQEKDVLNGFRTSGGRLDAMYEACYGAAIQPLDFVFGSAQTAKIIEEKKKRELLAAKLIGLLCVACAVILLALSGVQRIALSHELNTLNKQKDELKYIQDIYNAYVDTKSQYDDVTKMNGKTETVSDALADAIEEMEEKFPSGVKVTSLTSNGEGISMDIEVSTKEEAAKILQNLATFDAFRSVTTNGITESTDENGKITVTFSVMCTYVNGTADDSIDTETTPEEDVETYMNGDQYIYPDMEGSTESGEADNE